MLSEIELIRLASKGDEASFRELVRRHESALAATITAMLGPGDDADDVGQETFVRFFRALPKFRGDSSVRTYLTRIAVNLSIDVLSRRKKTSSWIRIGEAPGSADIEARDETTDLETADLNEKIRAIVDDLDPAHRAVVIMRILEERSTRETSEILGVPEGTVMSRLKRAMAKLETRIRPLIAND
jgi:RNA polymerase sigma-70 factor (ECF subfamily)